jgi:hypothetical protein
VSARAEPRRADRWPGRVTASPTRPDLEARPGDDENLEAHRLRATAEMLIQIADRVLNTPAIDMSPADSARVGAATRLTERALKIVRRTLPRVGA